MGDPIEAVEARIRADPDDIEAWKVYADWLLDHGDRRGELIGLELQSGSDMDPSLRRAIEALRGSHGAAWEPAELPIRFPTLLDYGWRHGFVHSVMLRRIDQRGDVRALQGLFADPQARLLGSLTLDFRRAKKQLFKALTHLDFSRLSWFGVGNVVGADNFVHTLIQEPTLALTRLELSYGDLTDKGVSELVGCPKLRGLRRLSLQGNAFGREGIEAIANASGLSELEELELHRIGIDVDGALALAMSPFLKRLTHLCVDVEEDVADVLSQSFSRTGDISWRARS